MECFLNELEKLNREKVFGDIDSTVNVKQSIAF